MVDLTYVVGRVGKEWHRHLAMPVPCPSRQQGYTSKTRSEMARESYCLIHVSLLSLRLGKGGGSQEVGLKGPKEHVGVM